MKPQGGTSGKPFLSPLREFSMHREGLQDAAAISDGGVQRLFPSGFNPLLHPSGKEFSAIWPPSS
ncbi:hypothetical protein SAMN06298226_2085 [Nitrosovibrio sp. Nv4]|nr:hypothetical protein SAMN06298226_2085 [Nitrosovibrio sp. Nv4]